MDSQTSQEKKREAQRLRRQRNRENKREGKGIHKPQAKYEADEQQKRLDSIKKSLEEAATLR
jgi:hypothetical protein